jgi:uncharacterized protein YukE
MATLHMEVDSVRTAQSKMVSEKDNMLGQLESLTSQINQTVGSAWIGNSANEFQEAYEGLRSQITSQLEQMEALAQNLASEIAQWEDMAARMG